MRAGSAHIICCTNSHIQRPTGALSPLHSNSNSWPRQMRIFPILTLSVTLLWCHRLSAQYLTSIYMYSLEAVPLSSSALVHAGPWTVSGIKRSEPGTSWWCKHKIKAALSFVYLLSEMFQTTIHSTCPNVFGSGSNNSQIMPLSFKIIDKSPHLENVL